MKSCIKCKNVFEVNSSSFYKRKSSKDGFEDICKTCKKIYDKQYKTQNREKVYAQCRTWNKVNKERLTHSTQNWIQNNLERHKVIKNKAFEKYISLEGNKIKRREYDKNYTRNKRQTNTEYKVKDSIGSIIYYHLNKSKSEFTVKYLGCSIKEYIIYLENRFLKGMHWENYGEIWEIDHIIPLSSFDLTQEDNIFKAFNYQNTQPLFKTTEIAENLGYFSQIGNRNKSNKLI